MFIWYRWFSLSHIFLFSKLILSNCFLIFHCFLYYHCFWKTRFKSLIVNRHSSSIKKTLFSITKSMLCFINFPVVTSTSLFSWSKITMSFGIHLSNVFIFFLNLWIEYIFCTFAADSGITKCKLFVLCFFRPFISSFITFSKWFFYL